MKCVWSMRTQFYLANTLFMNKWYDDLIKALPLISLKHLEEKPQSIFHPLGTLYTQSLFKNKNTQLHYSRNFQNRRIQTVSILVCLPKEQLTTNISMHSLSTINLKTFHFGNLYKLHSLETYHYQTKIH